MNKKKQWKTAGVVWVFVIILLIFIKLITNGDEEESTISTQNVELETVVNNSLVLDDYLSKLKLDFAESGIPYNVYIRPQDNTEGTGNRFDTNILLADGVELTITSNKKNREIISSILSVIITKANNENEMKVMLNSVVPVISLFGGEEKNQVAQKVNELTEVGMKTVVESHKANSPASYNGHFEINDVTYTLTVLPDTNISWMVVVHDTSNT